MYDCEFLLAKQKCLINGYRSDVLKMFTHKLTRFFDIFVFFPPLFRCESSVVFVLAHLSGYVNLIASRGKNRDVHVFVYINFVVRVKSGRGKVSVLSRTIFDCAEIARFLRLRISILNRELVRFPARVPRQTGNCCDFRHEI